VNVNTAISRRCRHSVRLCLEQLEARDQPSVIISVLGGQLTITGSPSRDVIRIGDDGQGNIAVISDPIPTPLLFHGITSIKIQTFAGADSVHYDLLGSMSGSRGINIDLGTGSKDFQFFTNNNELLPNANLSLTVHATGGNQVLTASTGNDPDQGTVNQLTHTLGLTLFTPFQLGILRFGPHTGTDLALGAHLGINLFGGSGSNVINVNYEGIDQGTLTVNEQGASSPGKDQVNGLIQLLGGTNGTVNAHVAVNPGRDRIFLRILELLNSGVVFSPTIHGLLDGGRLKSITRRTFNVNVLNSSSDVVVSS
jgi:hypothetical protein